MHLKDYGTYTIVLNHLGNEVIKDLSIFSIEQMRQLNGYAYLIIKHGKIIDRYGTVSHLLDIYNKDIDWDRV